MNFVVEGAQLTNTVRPEMSNLEAQISSCLQPPLPTSDLLMRPLTASSSVLDSSLASHSIATLSEHSTIDTARLMEMTRPGVGDTRSSFGLAQTSNVFAFPPVTSELNRTASTSYPLLSPHSLIHGTAGGSSVTSAAHTFLPSSPTFAGVYPPAAPSVFGAGATQPLPHQYVQTNEGRTLELLGATGTPFDPTLRHSSSIQPTSQLMTSASMDDVSSERKPDVKADGHAQSYVWRPHV